MQSPPDGNTEGSLTPIQHAVLEGSLLGDGTLRKQGARLNALFEVNHSARFKEYVDWKYSVFQEHVLTPPKTRKGNGRRVACRFTTRSLPVFTAYFERFYKKGRKTLPVDLVLSPLSLAVWFMDDGSRSRSSCYLNTQQFSADMQKYLVDLLKRDFGIESGLNRDKQYFRLRVTSKSTRRLVDIVRPHILKCFWYKLGDDPVTTDSKEEALDCARGNVRGNTPTLVNP